MRQTTADALRANEEMLAAVHGRAKGRIGAWPLLLGFGTCSAELMRAAKALADRYGVGWGMMHFAAHPSRKTADRIPLDELDALGVLGPNTKLAHMVYVDDADIRLLAKRGVKVSHCPSAALKHTKGLVAHGRFPEMLDAGVSVSLDRKSTRLNSSHLVISYAVFCLKKKNNYNPKYHQTLTILPARSTKY